MRLLLLLLALTALSVLSTRAFAQESYRHPLYVSPAETSGLPLAVPEDSRATAGVWSGDTLVVDLVAQRAEFRPEGPGYPGILIEALAVRGEAPTVPGPLIRVEEGQFIRIRFTNQLADSTLTVFGFAERPITEPDSLVVLPGESATRIFRAGEAGTYLYRVSQGPLDYDESERDTMTGALIVDAPGDIKPDRVIVMNVYGQWDPEGEEYLESLTMNGRSWPHSETFTASVGDTLRWRVVNANHRRHPMHLHGFYYDVLARGNLERAETNAPGMIPSVVTGLMMGYTTMEMEWVASRPGNWLFHCHLSFHVGPGIRLPGASEADPEGEHPHMAGLVNGIRIEEGPSDLISTLEPRFVRLDIERARDSNDTPRYAMTLDDDPPGPLGGPGPLLMMRLHQPTWVTVNNRSDRPTGVHWHGLELDSWADGVPGWSRSDGRVSPVIQPDSSFTYKLSAMRPGTFIYHSHLNDARQLRQGLYGPLLVLGADESYDPVLDHFLIFAWYRANPGEPGDIVVNGRFDQPDQQAKVGEVHRLRFINIAPAGPAYARMSKDGEPVPMRAVAKDGADLPEGLRVALDQTPLLGVGETADFLFEPGEPGVYQLHLVPLNGGGALAMVQRWVVR